MKYTVFFILGIITSLCFSVLADKIPSPPLLKDPALLHYLKIIYDNHNRLEVVTSNPDGSRKGKKGDMVLLQTGGNSYLEVNSDSNTTWLGTQLTNTP